jgi:pantetheine-phosphate adenylyltransferase
VGVSTLAASKPDRPLVALCAAVVIGSALGSAARVLTPTPTNGVANGCNLSWKDRYNPAPRMARAAHHALFPGSFDPVTLGHVDLVTRALALVSRGTVAVAVNPDKAGLFSADERVDLLRRSLAHLDRVGVELAPGLVVEAARDFGCDLILRGVRSGSDFDYEAAMARTNRVLSPGLETLLMVPAPELAHVSSTLVRQIALCGGDPSAFVPAPVAAALLNRHSQKRPPRGA